MAIIPEFEFYSESCKHIRENGESIRYLGGTIYYRCIKSLPDNKVKSFLQTDKSTKTEIARLETSPDNFVDEFINEKASRANLYPNSIYKKLLMTLRDKTIRKTQDLKAPNEQQANQHVL
ncbi:hypothetical protein HZS_3864 [Henneguya salminicola]|nr:hypothetical protein HZS_3864 [Henneguya salminicola]